MILVGKFASPTISITPVLEDVEHADAVRALREAGKIVHLVNKRL